MVYNNLTKKEALKFPAGAKVWVKPYGEDEYIELGQLVPDIRDMTTEEYRRDIFGEDSNE